MTTITTARHVTASTARRALLGATLAMLAAGCTGSDSGAVEGVAGPLTGVCPDPLVVQTDWHPEAEHAAVYQLVDPDHYDVDTEVQSVTGRLVAGGEDMGIDVEVRMGGEAIGFQQVPHQMYLDTDIFMGLVATDEAIMNSENHPTIAVLAPLQVNPQMIMWDPETYDVATVAGLPDDTVVSVFGPDAYLDHLIDTEVIRYDQIDWEYTGTPIRFVEAEGAIAQQGSATADPFVYENEVDDWERPVRFQLLHDLGWENYVATLAVRPDTLETDEECLTALVPVVQRAIVEHVADPGPAHELIVDLADRFDTGWVYERDLAEWSLDQQLELGVLANGPDGTVGSFDRERVQDFVDLAVPLLGIGDGLTAEALVTDEFIDPTVRLPPG